MTRLISALPLVLSLASSIQAGTLTFDTYYHNDHLGSPVAATDERSDLLWRAHFRPYGERQENPEDAAFGNVGYTGHMQNADSSLVYMQARYYDPLIGRFLAVDPIGFQQDNAQSFNRYAYVNNNPHKYIDPDGREASQIGIQFSLPKAAGLLSYFFKPTVETTGISFGLAFSSPNIKGEGEFDVGLFTTLEMDSHGFSTGKVAVGYSEALDSTKSVKDLAGIEGTTSIDLVRGGLDVSYDENGIGSLGLHMGIGAGASASASATSVVSLRHMKTFGFNQEKSIDANSRREDHRAE